MTFRTKNRRLICAAVCAGVILALGGCGGEGEKTQSAMGMIQELNYTEAVWRCWISSFRKGNDRHFIGWHS